MPTLPDLAPISRCAETPASRRLPSPASRGTTGRKAKMEVLSASHSGARISLRTATAAVARRPPRAGTPRTTPSARPHYISYASRAAASSVW